MSEETSHQIPLLDRIDTAMRAVGFKLWSALSFFLILLISTIIWGFVGEIPSIVEGKALITNPSGVVEIVTEEFAIVESVQVKIGERVKSGDTLITLRDSKGFSAPSDGRILWIEVKEGDEITPNTMVLRMERDYPESELLVLGFIPLFSGQKIKPGMKAKIALDVFDSNKEGKIEGSVKAVQRYPVDENNWFIKNIPSKSLQDYLMEGSSPYILVVIEPQLDSSNRLQWTTKKRSNEVYSGMTGEVQIVTDERKPITYILPFLNR